MQKIPLPIFRASKDHKFQKWPKSVKSTLIIRVVVVQIQRVGKSNILNNQEAMNPQQPPNNSSSSKSNRQRSRSNPRTQLSQFPLFNQTFSIPHHNSNVIRPQLPQVPLPNSQQQSTGRRLWELPLNSLQKERQSRETSPQTQNATGNQVTKKKSMKQKKEGKVRCFDEKNNKGGMPKRDEDSDDEGNGHGPTYNDRTLITKAGHFQQTKEKRETGSQKGGSRKSRMEEAESEYEPDEELENGLVRVLYIGSKKKAKKGKSSSLQLSNEEKAAINAIPKSAIFQPYHPGISNFYPPKEPVQPQPDSDGDSDSTPELNPYRGRHNSFPVLEYILSEVLKRIVVKHFKVKQRQIRELASNIFKYLKQFGVYKREDQFKNSKGWLEKYLRRNPEVEAMIVSVRQEAEVKPWMLKYTDLWLFLLNRALDPALFQQLPLRTQKGIRRERKQATAKSNQRRGFINVRTSSNMPNSETEERHMAEADLEDLQQSSGSEANASERSGSEEYLDKRLMRIKRGAMEEEDQDGSDASSGRTTKRNVQPKPVLSRDMFPDEAHESQSSSSSPSSSGPTVPKMAVRPRSIRSVRSSRG